MSTTKEDVGRGSGNGRPRKRSRRLTTVTATPPVGTNANAKPTANAKPSARAKSAAETPPRAAAAAPAKRAIEPPPLSLLNRLRDAAGDAILGLDAFSPAFLRRIEDEVAAKLARAPMDLNAYGYDPWGLQADVVRRSMVISTLVYRYYFRVETRGAENLPSGRVLLIGNHAGQIALDAAMIAAAAFLEADPPRIVRGMGEYWLPRLPFLNVLMVRAGSVVGTPKNCVDLLDHGEAVIAFPEGVRGMNKSFTERYVLQEFGLGFLRLALETKTPIVPVAVVGSEEQAPSLGNWKTLARLLGMPAFPLVLAPVPLPVKYHIEFGAPMTFEGNPHDEDRVIGEMVEKVKSRIRRMMADGLARRKGVFL